MKYDFEYIKEFLYLEHPRFIRGYLITFLLLLDFFGVIISICDPFTLGILIFVLVIILPINIWGLVIYVNPIRFQKNYTLFSGVNGIASSVVFIVLGFKIWYSVLGYEAIWFAAMSVIGYLLSLYLCFRENTKALNSYFYAKIKNKKRGQYKNLIWLYILLGMLVLPGRVFVKSIGGYSIIGMHYLAFTLTYLAWIFSFAALHIRKYILINQNIDKVKFYKPEKVKTKK